VSRETANRYLLYLHDQHIVDRVADSQGPGRPRYRYTPVAGWRAS
jgi:predicted transcriptional regulator